MQWKSDTAQVPEHAASLIGKLRASFANGLTIVLKTLKRFFVLISRIRYGLSPKRWGSVQDLETIPFSPVNTHEATFEDSTALPVTTAVGMEA